MKKLAKIFAIMFATMIVGTAIGCDIRNDGTGPGGNGERDNDSTEYQDSTDHDDGDGEHDDDGDHEDGDGEHDDDSTGNGGKVGP